MVIVNYKAFEQVDYHHPVTSFVVGMPSGEVINTTYDAYTKLKAERIIKYDKKLDAFVYQDANYRRVLKFTMDKEKIDYIESTLFRLGIDTFTINPDYSVDVKGSVDIREMGLSSLPVKFRNIEGDFDCSYNNLKNLVNSPDTISGLFDCSLNSIYTLIGGPRVVMGGYYCSDNKLTDLQGFPEKVYEVFDAERNELTTLKGAPEILTCQEFTVAQNKLVNLHYGPKKGFNFDCSQNDITTLENGVKELHGVFDCNYNMLRSLIGKPHCDRIRYRDGNQIKVID